jgi:hypothetical protein
MNTPPTTPLDLFLRAVRAPIREAALDMLFDESPYRDTPFRWEARGDAFVLLAVMHDYRVKGWG